MSENYTTGNSARPIKELAQWAVDQDPSLAENLCKKNANHMSNVKKPKKPKQKHIYYCEHCGAPHSCNTALCSKCARLHVLDRPSAIEIARTVKEKGFWRGARDYGVTDNAMRKWCKDYGIPIHTQEVIAWLDAQETQQ